MINPDDLRIGNWLIYNEEPIQITAKDLNNISVGDKTYNPIPITEEWLEKFGFGNWPENTFTFICDTSDFYQEFSVFKNYNSIWNVYLIHMLSTGKKKKVVFQKDFHFIHQLQNLIHSATNIELELEKQSPSSFSTN